MAGSSSSGGPSASFTVYNPGSSVDRGAKTVVIVGLLTGITDTVIHTLVSAQGGAVRAYLGFINFANNSGTNALVTLTDGTTTIPVMVPANGNTPLRFPINAPFISQPNTPITIQSSAAANLSISCIGFQGS